MDTTQKAGVALVLLILLKALVYMLRFYNRQKHQFPKPTVILVIGPHLGQKFELVRTKHRHAFSFIHIGH